MELEKEIELLKEKVGLLERIRDLQNEIIQQQTIYVPYYPYYLYPYPYQPNPWNHTITWTSDSWSQSSGT